MDSRKFWLMTLGGLAAVTLLLGWGVNRVLVDQRIEAMEARLLLKNNLRREALSRYLDTAEAELRFWSTNSVLVGYQRYLTLAWRDAVAAGRDPAALLRKAYIDNNPFPAGQRGEFYDRPQQTPYRTLHSELHPLTRQFVTERGYYDFFLIDPDGNIAYSVEKEDDFATNLLTGPYRDTGLADVFRRAIAGHAADQVVFSDFERYAPSNGDPAMFMANAMHDQAGELMGVLALQLPTHQIAHIMDQARSGTDTGEAYIVGEDLLMRSESRFSETPTVLSIRVDTEAARRALNGEYGVMLTEDYRREPVYSAYSSISVDGHHWALLMEMDRAEVLEWASGHQGWLAGLMLLFYSLGAFSAWYLRGADLEAAPVFADFDAAMEGGLDGGD